MLPESTFPVTGGIMQTEEVAPRAKSTGLDGSLSDISSYQHSLHHTLPALLHMAVKQEPQEEEEGEVRKTNNLGLQSGLNVTPLSNDGTHFHQLQESQQMHDGTTGQLPQDHIGRVRPSRCRRKSRWKLKFHHQALPPEYLDHYEAALAQEAMNASSTPITETSSPSPAPTTSTSTPSPIADVHGWLQRITAIQQEFSPPVSNPTSIHIHGHQPANPRRSVITSTTYSHANNNHSNNNPQTQSSTRAPMKYSDLPYMGEITLDNNKPRRGRKPKKADICHLIYKNYGTILPGTPVNEDIKPKVKQESNPHIQTSFQRTDIQNRISSLLERRLTQESRTSLPSIESLEQDEPLNLCIRDVNQLKLGILKQQGAVSEPNQLKSEASSDDEEIECLSTPFSDSLNNNKDDNSSNNNNNTALINNNNSISPGTGIVYWPNANVFIHPMALQSQFLYYQKMAQNEKNSPRTENSIKEQKIVPKSSLYSILENKSPIPNAAAPSSQSVSALPPPVSPTRPKRNASSANQLGQPSKRKRSAIFIPPMPTENNNNPATEVSICKFKFTGGAKPSLQEKKSVFVDAGGNYRYYSGTGDKSMRGYEFYPREALQQSAVQAGSSAEAFLNVAAKRVPVSPCQRSINQDEGRRKRKTRKSLQREKLEQTFKEKGFLIQTQQTESAAGGTFCKFRQLRKFTRYLFRSWKHHLPGNVQEMNVGVEGEFQGIDIESDPSGASSTSVDISPSLFEEPRSLTLAQNL